MDKTVFIVITRGFIIRNILRSGVLSVLRKFNLRIVIFVATRHGAPLPNDFMEEFNFPDVILHNIDEPMKGKWFERIYRVFGKYAGYVVYTGSTWIYSQVRLSNLHQSPLWAHCKRFIFRPLSAIHFFKKIIRLVESWFYYKNFSRYFDLYSPQVVFSTSIISKIDIAFMKEARRRKIKTVSMPKGWDNITAILYRFVPDLLIVQNKLMQRDAIRAQRIPAQQIRVCGFPQFDWYLRKEVLLPREQYMKMLGFPPHCQIIFFGSEGAWSPEDHRIAEYLAKFVERESTSTRPLCLLIRPHWSDVRQRRFDFLEQPGKVHVDTNYTLTDIFHLNWNPTTAETKLFTNTVYHCDVLVTIASTLVLDAACVDKPAIVVSYGVLYHRKTGKDISSLWYQLDHFRYVLGTGAVDVADNDQELDHHVRQCLNNPKRHAAEREILRNRLCGPVDGQASERIARAVLEAAGE